jgi:signal transduction histidine kinase
MRGVPFAGLLSKTQQAVFEDLITQTENGQRLSVDIEILSNPAEEKVATIATSAALLGSEGMILLTMRDVTQERQMARRLVDAQQKLIQTEKQTAIMEVAGAAAHELNQPLTVLLTSIAMLKRILSKTDNSPHKLLDAMENELDRMTKIIQKLSSLTDYTTKDYVGQSKIVDLDRSSKE